MAGYGFAKEYGKELAINLNWFSNPRFFARNRDAYLAKRKAEILQFTDVANSRIDKSKYNGISSQFRLFKSCNDCIRI